jgi:hypothetical protein
MIRRSEGPVVGRQVALRVGQELYVPAHPRGIQAAVAFELREVDQLGPAILTFSTHARLVAALGDFQPWVCVNAAWLANYAAATGLAICLDPEISKDVPRWTANDLAEFIGGSA